MRAYKRAGGAQGVGTGTHARTRCLTKTLFGERSTWQIRTDEGREAKAKPFEEAKKMAHTHYKSQDQVRQADEQAGGQIEGAKGQRRKWIGRYALLWLAHYCYYCEAV